MLSKKLLLTVFTFITILLGIFIYNVFLAQEDSQIYNLDFQEDLSDISNTLEPEKIEENLPEILEVTLSGEVKSILAKSHSPSVIVYLDYVGVNNKQATKAVALNYDNKYKFENIQIKPSSIAKLYIKSDTYVFYPASYKFEVNEKFISNNFEASIAESTKENLTISGNILGLSPNNGVVYVYGTSVVDNKAIKTLVPISGGSFVVDSIDSGSYLVIPSSENYLFFPKTKNIYVKNKPIKLKFFAVRRF